jgi:iron complex outermembrane receptor protein
MKKWCVVFLFLAALAMPGLSKAEEEEIKKPLVTLEEVVVTATRDAREIRKIPANITVIKSDDIKKSGATSLVDVLEKLAGIHFTTFSGNPSQAEIDMRGFGQNGHGRVLILLDGRRLNRPDMASINWLQIPINNVEKIEVVSGANSVLYGDHAVAGVINIITKRGEGKPEVSVSGIIGEDALHDVRVGLTGSKDRLSYACSGEIQETNGWRERTAFSSKGAGFNIGYDLSDFFNISLGGSLNKVDYEMPGNLTKSEMEKNRKQFQPARPARWTQAHDNDESLDEYYNVNLGLEMISADLGSFDVNFLYGLKDITSSMDSFPSYRDTEINTFGITPRYLLDKDILGHKNKLILGVDYYHETLDLEIFTDISRDTVSSLSEIEKNSVGYYINDELNLFDELILSAGARIEKAKIKGKETNPVTNIKSFDEEKDHHGEAISVGLTYLIEKSSKLFAKFTRLYRYPFIDEQASYQGWGNAFNKELEAEEGKSYEIGTEVYPIENLRLAITLFRIDMEKEIAWNNATLRNVNLDETRHQGLELNGSYKLGKKANIYGNYTYQEAKFTKGIYNDKDIPLVPYHKAFLGLELFFPYGFSLVPELRYTGECYLGDDKNNNGEKLEDYSLVDIFLRYRPTHHKYKPLVFVGIENLFNKEYSTLGYEDWLEDETYNTYYPSPGRIFKAGLSLMF